MTFISSVVVGFVAQVTAELPAEVELPTEVTPADAAIGLIGWMIFISSAMLWWRASRRVVGGGGSIIALRPRDTSFWTPALLLQTIGVFIVTFFVSISLSLGAMVGLGWIDPAAETKSGSLLFQILANTLAGVLAVIATLTYLLARNPNALRQLGITWPVGDGRLGLVAAVMLLPPVMILSGLVSHFVEYSHPVIDSLEADKGVGVFLVMLVGTAVITPFVEEFMFRVLLQGGLQGIVDRSPSESQFADEQRLAPEQNVATERMVNATDLEDSNPYAIGTRPLAESSAQVIATSTTVQPHSLSWWPMLFASAVFAAMHIGQGAAWIPLFFLSLGLGYLYRQTGSITAPFVVHAVLNFITMVVTFAQLD